MTSPKKHLDSSLQKILIRVGELFSFVRQKHMLMDEFLDSCICELKLSESTAKKLFQLFTDEAGNDNCLISDILPRIEKRFQAILLI